MSRVTLSKKKNEKLGNITDDGQGSPKLNMCRLRMTNEHIEFEINVA